MEMQGGVQRCRGGEEKAWIRQGPETPFPAREIARERFAKVKTLKKKWAL